VRWFRHRLLLNELGDRPRAWRPQQSLHRSRTSFLFSP
jgi:hypothetical protein